jgi:diadenosine tetraphosphate (Ap4A) HIT family hydrolase
MGGRAGKQEKGAVYDENGNLVDCVFCNIAELPEGDPTLIFRDDRVAVFYPLDSCAREHILIIPRNHIKSIRLKRENKKIELSQALLIHLQNVGNQVLDQISNHKGDRAFMFHLAPFNSIEHLHMHGFVLPFNLIGKLKFSCEKWAVNWKTVAALIDDSSKKPQF